MTKSEKRRRMRMNAMDYKAKREGDAIHKMHIIGPVQPSRLNHTYRTGQGLSGLNCTGKGHRKIG